MKKLLFTSVFICFVMASFAQTFEKRWAIGVYGGKTEYSGDWGKALFDFSKDIS